MALSPPPPHSVDRFLADLERALGTVPARLGVAVSGGPDSLALLLLARFGMPERVEAATVDHGLRLESGQEAEQVGAICRQLSVPHRIIRLNWPKKPTTNIQATAREARYIELGAWAAAKGIQWVATAHHLDDQAETLLMRLARGSGIGGLSGIRPIGLYGDEGRPVWAVRPLLGWSKAELVELVDNIGLAAVDDPSNDDDRFDRTRARQLLAATPWLAPGRLAAAAANLTDAEEALQWSTNQLFKERVGGDPPGFTVDAADLPNELQRRLIGEVLRLLTGQVPSGPKLARLLDSLRNGKTATLAGLKATSDGSTWRFEPAPPRRSG